VVGVTGNPGQANYVASKGGPHRHDQGGRAGNSPARGITVNAVAPGFMGSAMTDALNDQQRENHPVAHPFGRDGQRRTISARPASSSPVARAGYVTGQTLHVNGGMAMP